MTAIAGWVLLRDRHRRWSIVVLGLGICTVPTPLPLLVLPWLWWQEARREITLAVLIAVTLCVPFAAWAGFGNFFHDVVVVQLLAPTRLDALTVDALLAHLHRGFLIAWVGILASGILLMMAAVAGPRRWDAAFLLGGVLSTAIFLTAKWAFFDYYFIVVYAVLIGLSLASDPAAVGSGAPISTGHLTPPTSTPGPASRARRRSGSVATPSAGWHLAPPTSRVP